MGLPTAANQYDDYSSHAIGAPEGIAILVAIPAFDEAVTVGRVVSSVPRSLSGARSVDVLVVDDGSSDATSELSHQAGARVIRHARNMGAGSAFRTTVREAIDSGADLLVTLDADGQFNPADIPKLIEPVVGGRADFSTASRFVDPALEPEMPWLKRWGNRQMSRLISSLTGQVFHDVSCGMRCYSRRALLNLNLMGRFTYTQEVFLNLAFKDLRIAEVPIAVRGEREHGNSKIASNLWAYAVRTFRIIFRAYRDYHPMRFFGGIAAALIVPGIMLWGFLLIHYLESGSLSPHKWSGVLGAGFVGSSLLMAYMGLIGDLLKRHRVYLEEILFHQRLQRPPRRKRWSAQHQRHQIPSLLVNEYRDPEQIRKLLNSESGRILFDGSSALVANAADQLKNGGFAVYATNRSKIAIAHPRPSIRSIDGANVVFEDSTLEFFDIVIHDVDPETQR